MMEQLLSSLRTRLSDVSSTALRPTPSCVGPNALAKFVASVCSRARWAILWNVAAKTSGRSLPLVPSRS